MQKLLEDEWGRALFGITGQQIAMAWEKVKIAHPTWPPSPQEFRNFCFEHLVLPDPERAFAAAIGKSFGSVIHPAVSLTLKQIDSWEWRHMGAKEAKKTFLEEYAKIIAATKAGEVVFPESEIKAFLLASNNTALPMYWVGSDNAPETQQSAPELASEEKTAFTETQMEANKKRLREALSNIATFTNPLVKKVDGNTQAQM